MIPRDPFVAAKRRFSIPDAWSALSVRSRRDRLATRMHCPSLAGDMLSAGFEYQRNDGLN